MRQHAIKLLDYNTIHHITTHMALSLRTVNLNGGLGGCPREHERKHVWAAVEGAGAREIVAAALGALA